MNATTDMKKRLMPIIAAILLCVTVSSCRNDVVGQGDDTTDGKTDVTTEEETTAAEATDTDAVTTEPECDHEYEIIIHQPTCTEEGYTEKICHKCGLSERFDVKEKTEHRFGEDTVTEPTCTEDGKIEHTCEICGQTELVEKLDALGHDFSKEKTVKPTCTKYGYTEKTCSRCGEKKTVDSKEPLGHSYGEWSLLSEPTCHAAGSRSAVCERCGKETTEEIPKLEHIYNGEPTCLKPSLCTLCGETEDDSYPLWHEFGEGEKIDMTDGVITERYTCKVCGAVVDVKSGFKAPDELVNTSVMRSLSYLGYDVKGQIENGTLFTVYGDNPLVKPYLSQICYDMKGANGYEGNETVASSKSKTGLLPDVKSFKKRGLICASFTTYYLLNYLPNVEGLDTSAFAEVFKIYTDGGYHLRAVLTWHKALAYASKQGLCEQIGTSMKNVDRSKLSPGDVIIFKHPYYNWSHVALYAGRVDGEDFIIHCGGLRGLEMTTISIVADPYHDGSWEGSTVKEIWHIPMIGEHDKDYK